MSQLNGDLPVTLQYQLRNLLLGKIKSHQWDVNSKIPSEREICEQYSVSRTTVREVLKDLEREGYLVRKQGKGTFVKYPAVEQKLTKFYSFSEEIRAMNLKASTQIVSFEIIPADGHTTQRLSIREDDSVYAISRLRLAGDHVFAYERSYIPYDLIPGITPSAVEEQGLYRTITACSNLVADEAVEEFDAVNCPAGIAQLLGVAPRTALLQLTRTTQAQGVTIEYCVSFVRSDRYKYKVVLK